MAKMQAVEVAWQDQQNINTFNRLNSQLHDLDAQIKAKKKLLEDLEDAGNELMLSDEEVVRYGVGGVFVHVPKDDAEERLGAYSELTNEEIRGLQADTGAVREEWKALKAVLYSKFGASINLEEEL